MAYRIEDNLALLDGAPALVLCGTTRPAGFFAYPGLPSTPDDPDTRLIDLCTPRDGHRLDPARPCR